MARRVPDPMEKCAECAASPTSTMLPCRHARFRTVGKPRQIDRFRISRCDPSSSAKTSSRKRAVSRSEAVSMPAARQVASVASTMKVEIASGAGAALRYW